MKFQIRRDASTGKIRIKGPGVLTEVSENTAAVLADALNKIALGGLRGVDVDPETGRRAASMSELT